MVEQLFFNCPLIFPFLKAFYDCLECYFHNIEFHKEQFLLGFKEESLTLNFVKNLEKHISLGSSIFQNLLSCCSLWLLKKMQ
jgi:hypothetical protein